MHKCVPMQLTTRVSIYLFTVLPYLNSGILTSIHVKFGGFVENPNKFFLQKFHAEILFRTGDSLSQTQSSKINQF